MLSGRDLGESAERAWVDHHRDPALSEAREDRELFKEVGARHRDPSIKIDRVRVAVPPLVVPTSKALDRVPKVQVASVQPTQCRVMGNVLRPFLNLAAAQEFELRSIGEPLYQIAGIFNELLTQPKGLAPRLIVVKALN